MKQGMREHHPATRSGAYLPSLEGNLRLPPFVVERDPRDGAGLGGGAVGLAACGSLRSAWTDAQCLRLLKRIFGLARNSVDPRLALSSWW